MKTPGAAPTEDFSDMDLPAVPAKQDEVRHSGIRMRPSIAPSEGAPLLEPGMSLTLRPMRYPVFFDMYRDAIKNTWTVEEVDFSTDTGDLRTRMSPAETHLIQRLVAFFATGDSIVANNLVLNLYKHINAPEARLYLSRQLFEEALHVQFYLTLLDTYLPNPEERAAAFAAIDNIPSIRKKAEFCFKWIDSIQDLHKLESRQDRRQFLLNLICFAACIEGLCAAAVCSTASRRERTGCSATRAATWRSPSRWSTLCARKSRTSLMRSSKSRSAR
jgi:hypothetical protein